MLATLNACIASACLLLLAGSARAAYISELDFGGPGGQGIELSQVDPDSDYTLLFMNANPGSSAAFGSVLDVVYLPAGIGRAGVAMVTEQAWPDSTAATTHLSSLSPPSGGEAFAYSDTSLIVLMQGQSELERFNQPLGTDLVVQQRYDADAVLDWLVVGRGDIAGQYQSGGQDIDHINAELGIDLLSRLIDKDAGRVFGRAQLPDAPSDTPIDMETFYAGDPDAVSRQFDVDEQYVYTYTPGMDNLPLASHMPEPGSLLALAIGSALCLRRRGDVA